MNESLSRIQRELRAAVETQHYAEIQRLVLSFCEAAEAHARSLPNGDPRVAEIAALTQEVLQWTHTMVQAGRSCLVLQLRQIPKVKQYVRAPATSPTAVHMDV